MKRLSVPGARKSEPDPRGLSRRSFLAGGALAVVGLPPSGARHGVARAAVSPPASAYLADVPTEWLELTLELVRTTPGFSAPVASRAFGYAGFALYEAVRPGMPGRRSLVGRLNGLTGFPRRRGGALDWPLVANAALAQILRSLFPTAPGSGVEAISALERRFTRRACATLPPGLCRCSIAHGARVARHIFEWSRTDGGHLGFLRNFPPYTPPTGAGLWEPTPPAFLPALQPYWGRNRPFVQRSGAACSEGPPPPYSEAADSAFFAEASECYRAASHLTGDEEAMVRFWSDDAGVTATPPGHSI